VIPQPARMLLIDRPRPPTATATAIDKIVYLRAGIVLIFMRYSLVSTERTRFKLVFLHIHPAATHTTSSASTRMTPAGRIRSVSSISMDAPFATCVAGYDQSSRTGRPMSSQISDQTRPRRTPSK
jgi:hypothetical protein